jgi:hypothetical protein
LDATRTDAFTVQSKLKADVRMEQESIGPLKS